MRMGARDTFDTVKCYFVSLHMATCIADKGSGITATAVIITPCPTIVKRARNNAWLGVIRIIEIDLIIIIILCHVKALA